MEENQEAKGKNKSQGKRQTGNNFLESEDLSLFRSIVDNSHAGIFIIDNGFHIIYFNDRLCKIVGYSPDEITGRDFRDFLEGESRQLVTDRYMRRQKGEEVASRYEFNYLHRSGEVRRAELISSTVKESSGKAMVLGQILDITERRKADEKLWESENMFRSIVENSHAGIFIIDGTFHLTYANNMLSEILGYPVEEIVGSDFRRFLDEPSKQLVADRYIRRQKGEDLPSRYEFNFYRRGGELRNAELSTAVVRDAGGRVITVGQMLDITERKQAEFEITQARDELELRVVKRTAELQRINDLLQKEIEQHQQTQQVLCQSEIKYRHLIENANSVILEIDTEGSILFMNKFGLEFFGYREEEVLGQSIIDIIIPPEEADGKNLHTMIRDIVRYPERYASNESQNIKRNGEKVWMVWTNRPVYDEESRLKEILCIGINHTEQKLAQDINARVLQEKATAEERNRLARDLHDAVSQTLFSTSLIAEVLPHLWERDQTEGRRRLEEIRQLTRGALAEMRTLLLELRPSALVDAELSELMRQLAESITGRARIPVTVEVKGVCPPSPDLKVAVYRVAQEALNNVAKHSGASQAVVSLHCQPNKIELIIRDNGKGFDIGTKSTGSLGLGIMQERARSIGARVNVESRINAGTTVKMSWEKNPGRSIK